MSETKNLIEGLINEMNRVRELIKEYDLLPNGIGCFASAALSGRIYLAEKAIASNDIMEMLVQYRNLQSCK